MAADGSGWKLTDLSRQRCEGSRDGRRMRATARSRQKASRREDKGADTRGRHEEGVGPQQARRTLWRKSGASGSGLCPSGEKGFFADVPLRWV